MVATGMTVHWVGDIVLSRAYPDNNNSVTISFCVEGKSVLDVVAFGLPDERFRSLLVALGDDETDVVGFRPQEAMNGINTYLTAVSVIDKMEGKT